MIFAGIDVTLQANRRAVDAGPAMYLWTYCMLWMRDQKEDGFVPEDVAFGCLWGGPSRTRLKTNQEAVRVLVKCGLFVPVESGGWQIHNYAAKNDTREVIEARIESTRQRQQAFKERRKNTTPQADGNALQKRPVASESRVAPGVGDRAGVKASEGVQGGTVPADEPPRPFDVPLDEPIPPECLAYIETRRTSLKWVPPDIETEWAKYVAKTASNKPRGYLVSGWRAWLIDAEKYDRRDRERAGPVPKEVRPPSRKLFRPEDHT